jgi:hypothetical protein
LTIHAFYIGFYCIHCVPGRIASDEYGEDRIFGVSLCDFIDDLRHLVELFGADVGAICEAELKKRQFNSG